MDGEALNRLKDDDKKAYLEFEEVFSCPGWNRVVDLAKQSASSTLIRAASADTWEQNRFLMGKFTSYNELANLRKSIEAEFEAKAEVQESNGVEAITESLFQ